jgi:hypothetical protein
MRILIRAASGRGGAMCVGLDTDSPFPVSLSLSFSRSFSPLSLPCLPLPLSLALILSLLPSLPPSPPASPSLFLLHQKPQLLSKLQTTSLSPSVTPSLFVCKTVHFMLQANNLLQNSSQGSLLQSSFLGNLQRLLSHSRCTILSS